MLDRTAILPDTCNVLFYENIYIGPLCVCICVAESLHCPSETITALLVSYIPVQNKKFKIYIYIYL